MRQIRQWRSSSRPRRSSGILLPFSLTPEPRVSRRRLTVNPHAALYSRRRTAVNCVDEQRLAPSEGLLIWSPAAGSGVAPAIRVWFAQRLGDDRSFGGVGRRLSLRAVATQPVQHDLRLSAAPCML